MKPTILQEIFETKKRRVAQRRENIELPDLIANAYERRAAAEKHRLLTALSCKDVNIIAEIKRASPSKGLIKDNVDPAATARTYKRAGAKAISVLTEEDYFKGSMDDLRSVRGAVDLPILRKDFIFDEFQIYEAAAAGADAILLIVAMLDDETLASLRYVAEDRLGMDALIEVHDLAELERARQIGARLIGVNNRDLKTFDVSLDVSRDLIGSAPAGAVMVAESGLKSREDIMDLKNRGFNGFLIGETLMRSPDPEQTLNDLVRTTKVKICGITNLQDALFASGAGADALGFNFYEKSPRYISPGKAADIAKQLPRNTLRVGVFVNEDLDKIISTVSTVGLDAIQLHGNEPPEFVQALRSRVPLRVIKVFRVSGDFNPENVLEYDMDTIFLDAYSAAEYGGTGEIFDWEIARRVRDLGPKIYLAGGLSPENVAGAIRAVRPYGVDACSCLEREKGLKDNIKVRAFIEAVKGV
jgi:indole-3-glycerol phosphate synthase/phosphoribosylanthranilate isomerase/anthranilate synthase/indole-3-glycerol phosphate synthase/phosphoribosylanthranilate isomerase